MSTLEGLLEANGAWAGRVRAEDPGFFTRLAKEQKPSLLWIGCADSRVPADTVLDQPPGTVFVHRNIANLAGDDASSLAVVQYAVEVLQVRHVIVCGHDGCGGVRAAMAEAPQGHIGEWIGPLRQTYWKHRARVDAIREEAGRENLLCELNVREQVEKLSRIEYVRRAWQSGKELNLHGLVYSIAEGLLRDLGCSRSAP